MLVGGAVFLGGQQPEGRSGLLSLIEAQDGAGIAELVVPGTLPNVPTAQVAQVLNERLAAGETVESTRTLQAQGQRLTEVVTTGTPSAAPLVLCERPDGMILINCRVATATLEVQSGPDAFAIDFAGVELFGDEAQVQLVVVNNGDQPVTVARPFTVSAGGQQLDATGNAAELSQFGPGPQIEGDIEIPPGGAILAALTVTGDQVSQVLDGSLTVQLGGEAIELTLGQVTSFLS